MGPFALNGDKLQIDIPYIRLLRSPNTVAEEDALGYGYSLHCV